MCKWRCGYYFSFVQGGVQFSSEIEYIDFELDYTKSVTDAEFYISGVILDLYKFEDIIPQLTVYCYECRNNN